MLNEGLVYTNASDWLQEAINSSNGDVLLASPYLSFGVCRKLAASAARKEASWRLFTSLDPTAVANGYLSVMGLKALMKSGARVSHVDRLHTKTFIVVAAVSWDPRTLLVPAWEVQRRPISKWALI